MPSIQELFGPAPDSGFDLEAFLRDGEGLAADSAAKQYARAGIAAPTEALPGAGDPPTAAGVPAEPPVATPAPGGELGGDIERTPVPPAPPSALDAIPPDRQAVLLSLDRAMQDPDLRSRVLGALEPPAPAPAPPAPQLPAHIDPESFEAQMWTRLNQIGERMDQMASAEIERLEQARFTQRASAAANEAGSRFAARYEGRLSHEDVAAIATQAGSSGIAERFANGAPDLAAAFDQALEHVLWTNESWRQKLGTNQAPVATPEQQAAAEATTRKRQLSALSTGASPVAAPPDRTPLGYRSDGRLDNDSRLRMVAEAAGALRQNRESF